MVILVDENDIPLGKMEKIEAHEKALLHRAFSVFIFNSEGELLLQRRAFDKYHSAGLWTNTCCSHPFPGEEIIDAANRRLMEEMGLESNLEYLTKFTYKSEFDNGLAEHEIDHIFIGYSDDKPAINEDEVVEYKYEKLDYMCQDMNVNPGKYTVWFRIIFEKFMDKMSKKVES